MGFDVSWCRIGFHVSWFMMGFHVSWFRIGFHVSWGAFHLVKNSENSGLGLNGKRFFGSPDWKIPRKKWNYSEGSPVFPVGTSQWKFVFRLQNLSSLSPVPCLSRSFKRPGFLGLPRVSKKWRLIRGVLQANFRATTSALPAMF